MSHIIYLFLVLSAHFTLTQSEWVEITQNPTINDRTKSSIRNINKFHDGVSLSNIETEHVTTLTTPSPEWIAYQRERFQQQNSNTQKLVVSSGNHLKNSARIVVPARHRTQNSETQMDRRNRIVQTKNKIEVRTRTPEVVATVGMTPINVKSFKAEAKSRKHIFSDENRKILEEQNDYVENNEGEKYDDPNVDAEDQEPKNAYDNALKYPSIQGFFKFIRSIQKSLLRKTGFSIGSKIKVLKNLRDKLMRTIEERFMMLWQSTERKRSKRGILEDSNLNFPPEAALMSINFLTFAVFLIKLVLQVVQIVRSKHYSFTGFGINTVPVSKTTLGN